MTFLVLLLAAAMLVAGCGGGDDDSGDSGGSGKSGGSDLDGKALFTSTCGGCHALDDAGTSGSVGPKLTGKELSVDRVRAQIETGGGAMPPNLLEGEQADAVASYVSEASSK